MTQLVTDPCPWPLDPSCSCELPDGVDPHLIEQKAAEAGAILWRLSGWTYPACPVEVRPCLRTCAPDIFAGCLSAPWVPWFCGGRVVNVASCPCRDTCSCSDLCEVLLPGSPIAEVCDVVLDGEVLDRSQWRLDRPDRLVALDGCCWPCCQRMDCDLDSLGTFGVRYLIGRVPDAAANAAHSALACQLVRQCVPDCECVIPRNPSDIPEGLTGVPATDRWLNAVNPTGRYGGPVLVTPGEPRPRVSSVRC